MRIHRHARELVRRRPARRHARLRGRVVTALAIIGIFDALGSVSMWLLEDGKPRSQIGQAASSECISERG